MDEFIRENFGRIAAWLPPLLLCLAILATLAAWRLWVSKRAAWAKILGIGAAISTVGFSVVALFVAYGPMSPLFTNVQRLQWSTGEPVQDLGFVLLRDSSMTRLSQYRGSVVLVNLWATWCPPCVAELPTLNKLQTAYRDRGLIVITLSDETPASMIAFLKHRSPETVNGRVDSFDWLPIRDFRPFTLIIDRQGILRDYMFADQTYETFEKKIRPYL